MSGKALIPILLTLCAMSLRAQVDVLTAQYQNTRTSANMKETVLTTANVNAAQFGKLFSRPTDGPTYALPLVVTNFKLPDGGVHDLVVVATLNNSVYAYDAADPTRTEPYWHVSLGTPIYTGELFLGPMIGIVSTPVIDRSTSTIYLTAIVNNSGDVGMYIFALDLATGGLKYNSPQRLILPLATGEQEKDATAWYQRAGLLLSNGAVYVGYTYVSDDTLSIQHGFVQSFQANDMSVRLANWESSPNTPHAGVWQAGRGLAADNFGNLFVSTADGEWNGTTDFGNSVVELHPRTLTVESYFTPANWLQLFQGDTDLGANGVTLIPDSPLAITGGKQGVIYLMNRNNLGGLENDEAADAKGDGGHGPRRDRLVPIQSFQASQGCGLSQCGQYLSTAFWSHRNDPWLFVWDKQDYLRAYPFDEVSRRFRTEKATVGTIKPDTTGGVVVTSDESERRSGIVWAYTAALSPFVDAVPGTLRAFDATDITKEIYNSDQNVQRDATGSFVKFLSPVVANGHVYVGNQSGTLEVYGLLCQAEAGNLKIRPDLRPLRNKEKFTVTNYSGKPIAGPFSIVLAGLPAGVTVANSGGATACAAPAGNPWIAATDAPLWLRSGQSFTVEVTFNNPSDEKLHYSATVLAGSGGR